MRKGFSLFEILITGMLTSLIVVSIQMLVATSARSNIKRTQQDIFEMAKSDIANEFSNNLRWVENVKCKGSEKKIEVKTAKGATITYKVQGNYLHKDTEPMTTKNIKINDLSCVDRSVDPNLASLDITVEMQSTTAPYVIEKMQMVVSQRRTSVELD